MGILIAPLITEKQTDITEAMPTRYGFKVQYSADKSDIRKAVEETYGVTVLKVNTMRYSGKKEAHHSGPEKENYWYARGCYYQRTREVPCSR